MSPLSLSPTLWPCVYLSTITDPQALLSDFSATHYHANHSLLFVASLLAQLQTSQINHVKRQAVVQLQAQVFGVLGESQPERI